MLTVGPPGRVEGAAQPVPDRERLPVIEVEKLVVIVVVERARLPWQGRLVVPAETEAKQGQPEVMRVRSGGPPQVLDHPR